MPIVIEVSPELARIRNRFKQFPEQYNRRVKKTLETALLILHENVPAYPPAPESSWYVRTGTLGRSLGTSMRGGKQGKADIETVESKSNYIEARFGTNLNYAPQVIGTKQQNPWKRYWWNIKNIILGSQSKINQALSLLGKSLADYLVGKGLL